MIDLCKSLLQCWTYAQNMFGCSLFFCYCGFTPPLFNMAADKWWFGSDDFPFPGVYIFSGSILIFRGEKQWTHYGWSTSPPPARNKGLIRSY